MKIKLVAPNYFLSQANLVGEKLEEKLIFLTEIDYINTATKLMFTDERSSENVKKQCRSGQNTAKTR